MAIAFSLPSDECTLEHYRRIQQLLLDLINLLRTLITTDPLSIPSPSPNSPVPASGSHFGFPTPPSSVPNSPSPFSPSATSTTSAFVLPDVITSAASIEELRNYLIMRNSSPSGPVLGAAPASPFAPVPPSILRPSQEQNDPQRIPGSVEPVHNAAPQTSAAHKLRKRKRARISRKKKCCAECVQNESPVGVMPSSPQSVQTAPGTAATTCCYDRYRKIPKTKANQNECSCNDPSSIDTFTAHTVKQTPTHRHHHQITRNYVPSAADSDFYADPAYLRRFAAAAATDTANDDCKSLNSWMYVGEELKRMTDGYRQDKKDEKLSGDGLNGFISQCGRAVFAATLLVLGWKLLKQN